MSHDKNTAGLERERATGGRGNREPGDSCDPTRRSGANEKARGSSVVFGLGGEIGPVGLMMPLSLVRIGVLTRSGVMGKRPRSHPSLPPVPPIPLFGTTAWFGMISNSVIDSHCFRHPVFLLLEMTSGVCCGEMPPPQPSPGLVEFRGKQEPRPSRGQAVVSHSPLDYPPL